LGVAFAIKLRDLGFSWSTHGSTRIPKATTIIMSIRPDVYPSRAGKATVVGDRGDDVTAGLVNEG
jgi:hypothetical protein